jgi:hypothetical protein
MEDTMGSSGGGGGSGHVSHSPYLEGLHYDWLSQTGVDTISSSITDVMNSALATSPWTTLSAYNPDADIASYEATMTAFKAMLAGMSDTVDWANLYAQAELSINGPGNVLIAADIAAYQSQMDDNIATRVLPRFRRGMQDINAVVSSAFVIGEAVIEAFQARDVAKYSSELYMNSNNKKITATAQMMQMMAWRVGWEEGYVRTSVEAKRIKIVAKKEQTESDAAIDESDAKWDLEVFQYGGNLLGAIGGGTAIPNMAGKNKAMSALGGGMAGASAGGVIGGAIAGGQAGSMATPYGAIIGAVVGAAAAYFSS